MNLGGFRLPNHPFAAEMRAHPLSAAAAICRQTRQVILKCILITPLTSKHWWFSGRILACHAGGPGSIPGRDKVFLFLTVFIHSFNIVLREIRPKPGNLILDENFREFWKNREVREKIF